MSRNPLMRVLFAAILASASHAFAYEEESAFGKAKGVLELNCVECHTPEKAKGGLIMVTADEMKNTGDSGKALFLAI